MLLARKLDANDAQRVESLGCPERATPTPSLRKSESRSPRHPSQAPPHWPITPQDRPPTAAGTPQPESPTGAPKREVGVPSGTVAKVCTAALTRGKGHTQPLTVDGCLPTRGEITQIP